MIPRLLVGLCCSLAVRAAEIHWVDEAAVQKAKQAAVLIHFSDQGLASGFFVSDTGLVVTAFKMLEGCHEVIVQDSNGQRVRVTKLVATDEAKQIAVLNTGAKPPSFLEVSSQDQTLGSTCAVVYATETSIRATDAILLANIEPGVFPELESIGGLSLATKPDISGTTGAALISDNGKVVGMSLYQALREGSFLQPYVLATNQKTINAALHSAQQDTQEVPFPSAGPHHMKLGPHFEEGRRLLSLGDHAAASIEFEKTAREHPGNVIPLSDLANSLLEMGKLDEARKVTERVIQLAPDHPIHQARFAEILSREEKSDEALLYLRRMTVKFPRFAYSWAKLAGALMNLGQTAEAQKCAKKACELEPDSMQFWEFYRKLSLAIGMADEARLAMDYLSKIEASYFKVKYSAPKRQSD